jgi:hypothetical protein
MNDEESSQSAELNSDHGDIDPSFGAGLGGFVIACESPVPHQPAEGSLHDPAERQNFEARGIVRTFDDRDGQLGAQSLDPLSEGLAGVAAIHPEDAQPSEPTQHPAQYQLRTVAFGGAGRGHGHAEHQSQSIHQQMALAALDPLAGVIADVAAVTSRLNALTVQNRRRWPAAFAVSFPDECAQRIVERRPLMVGDPLPEDMINRFPMGKVGGQITPRATTLGQIQDGIDDPPPSHRRATAFGRLGQHGFEVSPLGIRKAGVIYGVFHAPTEAALKMSRLNPSRMSTHPSRNLSRTIQQSREPHANRKKWIIQTDSEQFFQLFWGQLLFIALNVVHSFKKRNGGHEFHGFSQIEFVLISAIRVWSYRLDEMVVLNGFHGIVAAVMFPNPTENVNIKKGAI